MSPSPLPKDSHPPTGQSQEPGHPWKVVTFYEDFTDAARSLRRLQGIVKTLSCGLPVCATSWSFDLLKDKKLNSLILHDVSHADVVVVATKGTQDLPERVRVWMIMAMAGKRQRRPTVIALHEDSLEKDGTPAPLCAALKKLAYRMDATFQCSRDLAAHSPAEKAPEPCCCPGGGPHTASESAQFAVTENPHWWGVDD